MILNFSFSYFRKKAIILILIVQAHFLMLAQPFVKINSGTKTDISHINMLNEQEGFFLADKVYNLNQGGTWKKADGPSVRLIHLFLANSVNDYWYTTSLENSTSMIYHYYYGKLETISGPFGLQIYSMSVTPDNVAFFSTFSEVAIYEKGVFRKVELAPDRSLINKIVGLNSHLFWILTNKNELFRYEETRYISVFNNRKVTDFVIVNDTTGYALCGNSVVRFNGSTSKISFSSDLITGTEKIFVSPNDEIWLIAPQSKILKISNGKLYDLSLHEKYYLNDLSFAGNDEVWIAGNDGLLLYQGKKNFPIYEKSTSGFSSLSLKHFNIDLDNEYGVALADFNGDKNPDIFAVCISNFNRLYINKLSDNSDSVKEIFFREEGAIRKSEGNLEAHKETDLAKIKLGVTVADVDNDGDEDIYVCYLNSRNKLLLNNGKGVFRDVSLQANRASENFDRSTAAAFADVDLDGNADLYVTSENGSNKLFHNDGTGHFTDITVESGLETISGGSCASFSDINNDGYPDLCATFWYDTNRLYINESRNGSIHFREITNQTDLAKVPPEKSNGVTFADVDNDGFSDLFIANRNGMNKIYLNDKTGGFKDKTGDFFPKNIFLSNGGVFGDFDQDGYQDLYLTNVGTNILYKNVNGLYFKDVTSDLGAELSGYSTGSAIADFDNDGDIDIYAANYLGGSSKVFINQSRNHNSLNIMLEGTQSNRDAIGAKIYLYTKNQISNQTSLVGFREISGGGGYASISAKDVIFTLLPDSSYYMVVKFPFPGSEMRFEDVKPGMLQIKEEIGIHALTTKIAKFILRTVKDPEIRREYLKVLFFLLVVVIYIRRHVRKWDRIGWIRIGSVLTILVSFFFLNILFIYTSSVVLFFVPILSAVMSLVVMQLITDRMQIADALMIQRMKLREKISRDLHDDLASTLGSISIYSDTLKRMEDPVRSDYKRLSLKIADLTQSALHSITDIIWMTSPRNDSLQGLLAKVNNLLYETLTDNGIQYHAEINTPDQSILMPDELKNDTFLILKEATHNIIRHAQAKCVTFLADVKGHTCSISLMDDGLGFDQNNLHHTVSHGNGLINIKRRAHESGIELSVFSHTGKGTVIQLVFKI